ncbi:MAG: pyrroloquinoline quinone biosynthesis peptide chaperone PqqD [Rhodobacteraceae bacterium]|nr:pyrroloquinoline quinone biosynthesis peptide chaperone PqqD [Paracoccaceae bacterium]
MQMHDRPFLPRGVRLHHDRVRGVTFLLAPEKAVPLDDIGLAILELVDGKRRLSDISAHLARVYAAPEADVAGDVSEFLDGLRALMYLRAAP